MAKKKMKQANSTPLEYDPELSKRFSKSAKIKECFNNCVMLFIYPERLNFPAERAFYVEGLAGGVAPIHHAWIELDGKIVDPTRHVLILKGHKGEMAEYVPKVRMTQSEVCGAYGQEKFPVWDYFAEMMKEVVKQNPELRDHPQVAAILGNKGIEAVGKPKAARKKKTKKG